MSDKIALLFLDLESGGLDPLTYEITEISWILDYDGETRYAETQFIQHDPALVGEWRRAKTDYVERTERNFYRQVPIDYALGMLHGQSDFFDVPVHLVGANPAFDHAFLDMAYKKLGWQVPYHFHLIDIEAGAYFLMGLDRPPTLGGISKALGVQRDNSKPHTSDEDVRETREMYYHLRRLAQGERINA